MSFRAYTSTIILLSLTAAHVAFAGANDIYLAGLIDDAGTDEAAFRALSKDLGLSLSPTHTGPAETTGQSGFDLAAEFAFHGIDDTQSHWRRGREGPGRLNAQPILPGLDTLALRARKGFILPIPLISEFEVGANWLLESQLVALSGRIKLALNEGFTWFPDVAADLGLTRLVTGGDLSLTSASAGATISKGFSVFGDAELVPFAAYEALFIDARTRPVDATPENADDVQDLQAFSPVQPMNYKALVGDCDENLWTCLALRHTNRASFGVRLRVALFQTSLGVDVDVLPERSIPVLAHGVWKAGLLF